MVLVLTYHSQLDESKFELSPHPSIPPTSALSSAPHSHHGLELLSLTLPAQCYPQFSLIMSTKTQGWIGRG